MTEYVSAPEELELALTAMGASPKVWFGTLKEIVGSPAATANVAFCAAAA